MGENVSFTVKLHNADKFIGNVSITSQSDRLPFKQGEDLRIASFSVASDRCTPLVILHTVASEGPSFKLEPLETGESREFEVMHSVCLKELKTAVIHITGGMELHLVAMNNGKKQQPCFWGFLVTAGLYKSCLNMLNLRCLALVFDLDETLIVANTMRSFEDRIEALGSKLKVEADPQKVSGMSSELKRYMQDRLLLKQYIEEDRVWDNIGEKVVNAELEVVPSSIEGGMPLKRPVVRLQERSMVFTRINPNIRDTSVLVRLRPAWEELRSYLTAKGRKRFEVFVCTMSEKEYALEMWRLLDPDAELISTKEMVDRIVCVKSGSKKSLANMFSNGSCYSKMAMVIDDRLKVWEDHDQPQVHVVPAFAPYYAPQAETSTPVPILCVARNVACNVRAGFFRDLDEVLSKKLSDVDFDAEISSLPQPPVVNNYMIVEEENAFVTEIANESKEFPDGMTDVETGKRVAESLGSSSTSLPGISAEGDGWKPLQSIPMHPVFSVVPTAVFPSPLLLTTMRPPTPPAVEAHDPSCLTSDMVTSLKPLAPAPSYAFEPPSQGSPGREEGEVPESELDPDTRRRLLILQHGQDTQHTQEPATVPLKSLLHVAIPSPAPAGGWLGAEEEMSPRQVSRTSSGIILEAESPSFMKKQSHSPAFYASSEFLGTDGIPQVYARDEKQNPDLMFLGHVYPENDGSSVLNQRDLQMRQNAGTNMSSNPVSVLQEIAQKCNTKLEFRSLLNTTKELQFSVEVLFGGDKVGEAIGRTKKEAQLKAADSSLRFMASQFISQPTQAINALAHGRLVCTYPNDESAPRWNARDPRFLAGLGRPVVDEDMPPVANASGRTKYLEVWSSPDEDRVQNPVMALKEYCTMEGKNVAFKSALSGSEQGYVCQVEVAGRMMGKGIGQSWEEAKQRAADEALKSLKITSQIRGPPKRMNPPRSPPHPSNKRMRSGEPPRGLQRLPPSPHELSPRRF